MTSPIVITGTLRADAQARRTTAQGSQLSMELLLPVIAANDARTKLEFDNLIGTGQSCVFAVGDLLDSPRATAAARGRSRPPGCPIGTHPG